MEVLTIKIVFSVIVIITMYYFNSKLMKEMEYKSNNGVFEAEAQKEICDLVVEKLVEKGKKKEDIKTKDIEKFLESVDDIPQQMLSILNRKLNAYNYKTLGFIIIGITAITIIALY